MPKSFLIKQRRAWEEGDPLSSGSEIGKQDVLLDNRPKGKCTMGSNHIPSEPTFASPRAPSVYFPHWYWPYASEYLSSEFSLYTKTQLSGGQEKSLKFRLQRPDTCDSRWQGANVEAYSDPGHVADLDLARHLSGASGSSRSSKLHSSSWLRACSADPCLPFNRSMSAFSADVSLNETSASGRASHRPDMLDVSPSPSLPDPMGTNARRTLDDMTPKSLKHFSCKYCEKDYMSLGALKMHIRTHTLPCRCKICGKSFSRPWLLQGHVRTHTGERPFSCSLCGRAFADRSNLRAHVQTHSDAKRYSCDRCGKTFSRMQLLTKHEEIGCYIK